MANLTALLQRLCDAEIDFVIVGGFAATVHGSSLLTRDLDVCMVLSAEHVDRLRELFRKDHPVHRMTPQKLSFIENPAPGTALKNLYLQTDLGAIDLLGSILGVGEFSAVAAGAVEVELGGRRVKVMSLDDLIKAKVAMGRPKDLLTAQELRAIREAGPKPG